MVRESLGRWFSADETGPHDPRTWLRDRWFLGALGAGLVARVLPLVLWFQTECIRDECIYTDMARDILAGQGLTTSNKGWLPSPGYPYLLAWTKLAFGSMQPVKALQVVVSLISIGLMYGIVRDLVDRKTARIAAFLLALNPTIAWFTNTMWIETIYIFLLLAAAAFVMVAHRRGESEGSLWSSAGAGVSLGGAILFRGVATYLPPFWVLALLYPGPGGDWYAAARAKWRQVAAMVAATVLVVAPYSLYGSMKYGGFMVTDATVGHVLYLGNNDFPPLTFDYGNGMLTQPLFGKYLALGRKPCRRDVPPVLSSKCEVQAAGDWVLHHPDTFLARVPLRIAQLLNPNSFLTRHVRWGYWTGLPWFLKEALAITIVAFSAALMVGGTIGAWARARGPYAWVAIGTTLYTVFTIALMYGMTRFRLPLEALWTPYLAMLLADPRATWDALRTSQARIAGALLTIPPILALMAWYLPTGFPVFW
jgi:4-amino-4-deoxy-L-arabinose transferase-like glycosyltransferase